MLILLLPPQHVYLFSDSSANDLAALENLYTSHWAPTNFYNFFVAFLSKCCEDSKNEML